ncbi:hypothetical protein ACRRTK_015738 [Alexandromys fortis]
MKYLILQIVCIVVFGYINYKCQFSWQKYAQMPKFTLCVFTLMVSSDFCQIYKEKLHFLKRLMVPNGKFLRLDSF